ncbi:MAG TPA: hypothetical protein VMV72_17755 [Verrucomicrobiae bacterium]|nr:hypothetical protein [Verrucomicrobiae bacterium]
MKTQFDALEDRLNALRPSPLPPAARRHILHEMDRSPAKRRSVLGEFWHDAAAPVAIAAVVSLALAAGWNWLPRPPLRTPDDQRPESTTGPFVAWKVQLAAVCPIGENTVTVLYSPSMLTNIQIRR